MAGIGIVAKHTGWWPDETEIAALGLLDGGYLTTLCYDVGHLVEMLARTPRSVNVIARFNSETAGVGHDFTGWGAVCDEAARRLAGTQVRAVVAGNELDLWFAQGDARLTPAFAARLARRMAAAFGPVGILSCATNVASGDWQGYLSEMVRSGLQGVDMVGLDPYVSSVGGFPSGQPWEDLADKIGRAYRIGGRPVLCPESGIKIRDAGGEDGQAEFVARWVPAVKAIPESVCLAVTYFAGHDSLGAPDEQGLSAFGLRRADGTRRQAWYTFARLNGGGSVPPAQFVLGFKRFHDAMPAIVGEPKTRPEFNTGFPGWQVQTTTRGILSWHQGEGMVFVSQDERVWRWVDGQPGPVEVRA